MAGLALVLSYVLENSFICIERIAFIQSWLLNSTNLQHIHWSVDLKQQQIQEVMAGNEDDFEINYDELVKMLVYSAKNLFTANGSSKQLGMQMKCMELFEKDYKIQIIDNDEGELCTTYPNKMAYFLGYQDEEEDRISRESARSLPIAPGRYRQYVERTKTARVYSRFILPCIFMKNFKVVSRAATISTTAEVFWKNGIRGILPQKFSSRMDRDKKYADDSWDLNIVNKKRLVDIELLKQMNIQYIVDMMVEVKKIKHGVIVSSSEKVDKHQRYKEFDLICTPFPGCELMMDMDQLFSKEGLFFDWTEDFVNTELMVPNTVLQYADEIDWTKYKEWDIVLLLQNYMLLMIRTLREGKSNMMIHCISGWDRTPMWTCLLRLSLWADGETHPNLNADEILYLTLAYDWFFFGHNLGNRRRRGEFVLHFTYMFLPYIRSEKYSIHGRDSEKLKERDEKIMAVYKRYKEIDIATFGIPYKTTSV
uniref:Tyrosine specific protein phosphatases domain-containing protein n=2 Tax=Clytia hemisphaerica TaxID=252671 RepID=A0A7M5VB12_9CNID